MKFHREVEPDELRSLRKPTGRWAVWSGLTASFIMVYAQFPLQ